MNYKIQRLNSKDLDLMRSLNLLFADVFEEYENYQSKPASDDYVTAFLSDSKNIVMVAVDQGQVIGGLVAYQLVKFEQERSEVYLYDLAVAKNHQNKGIGSNLIRSLQDTADELGAYVMFVQAETGENAVEFYKSLNPTEILEAIHFEYPTRQED